MPAPAAIRADQIRTLYDQSAPVLLANVVNVGIIAAASWKTESRPALLVWGALILTMTGVRLLLRQAYRRARPAVEAADRWGMHFVIGSLTAGVLWGAGGFWLFDPADLLAQLLITFAIGGMGAGAAGTLSCHLPAFWAFIVPAVIPLWIRVVSIGDGVHLAMAAMIVIYLIGLTVVARNTNRVVTHAFRLRFENETLLEQLGTAQLRLEETNRTLEHKVSERTAAFERQSEALRNAQRLEAVGRLAGGVAHDFNNLLTVIVGNTSLLLDQPLDPGVRAAIAETRTAAERGADLIRQLLAFGRRQVLAPVEVDLNLVLEELRPLLHRLLPPAGISMELSLARDPLFVLVDRGQIEQVLVNLVTNARDAMPGGGRIEITTAPEQVREPVAGIAAGPYAMLTVLDTGSGMDAETRGHAFEPFFTTKALGRGTGLGLATVHGIVEQSGGMIEVTSEPGRGSLFTVLLPQTTKVRDDVVPALSTRRPAALSPMTVLLVEDNPVVRSVTERMLRGMGHRVLTADSGEDALERAHEQTDRIDLLVSDVSMGQLDGVALAKRLLAERPGLRALLISGYRWERGLPSEPDGDQFDFLQKPFSSATLAERVERLLARPAGDAAPGARREPADADAASGRTGAPKA